MLIRQIDYVIALCKYRNISRASEELFITQPALSKYLRNLEDELGAPLFSRCGNELVPTLFGKCYYEYAKKIAELKKSLERECCDLLKEEKGTLTVAMPLTRCSSILPEIYPSFKEKYPNVYLNLLEESHSVERCLESTEIDIIIYNDIHPSENFEWIELGHEEFGLLISAEHPLAECSVNRTGCRYPWIDLSLFKKEVFIQYPEFQAMRKFSDQLFKLYDFNPLELMSTRNPELAILLASTGVAVALVPESHLFKVNFKKKPLFFSVGMEKTNIPLFAIYRKGQYLPSYAITFMDLIRKHMAKDNNLTFCER